MNNEQEILKLKHEILDILRKDNRDGCDFYFKVRPINHNFEKSNPNKKYELELTSYNPKKEVTFLIHKVEYTLSNEDGTRNPEAPLETTEQMLKYVKKSAKNKNYTYTIEWTWRGSEAKAQVSYFYARGPREALNKFYHSVDDDKVEFYNLHKNPIS